MATIDLGKYPQDLVDAVDEAISVPASRTAAQRPSAREVLASLEARGIVLNRLDSPQRQPAGESRRDTPGLSGLMSSFDAQLRQARERGGAPEHVTERRESA